MSVRILFPFGGETLGGSHISTAEIIAALDKDGYEPVIVLHKGSERIKAMLDGRELTYEELENIWFPGSFKDIILRPVSYIQSLQAAAQFICDRKIDIVHMDNVPPRYVWFYAALLAKAPYVHVQRTLLTHANFEKRVAYRYMDAVVSNSRTTEQSLPPLSTNAIMKIASPPITARYKLDDKKKNKAACFKLAGLPEKTDAKLVGFVANLHKRKRPDVFIDMAAEIKDQMGEGVKFLMAGSFYEGLEERLHTRVKEKKLESDLFFLGFQDDAQKVMSGCDVLVAPAVDEAFGRTLVESMLVGTPVVAAEDGGHKEIIEDGATGFLLPPDYPDMFAGRVMELLEDDALYQSIASKAYEVASKKYSAEETVKVFKEVYQALEGGKR